MFAQPLGEKGPFCRPGVGAAAVYATIEEKIVELHNIKRDLADNLLSGSNIASKLTTNDLIDLLRQNAMETEVALS